MPFDYHPYQKYVEDDVSEEEIDISESENYPMLEEPTDSYCLVYLSFCIIGITSLLPAYFFTVANQYWMYKFRDVTKETEKLNPLQVSYTAYASLASNIPLPISSIINLFINEKISCQKRIIGSLIIMLILFVITLVLVKIDTSSWQNGFLIVTFITILILNAASGILISTAMSIANKFSSKYITSFNLGQGLSGTISSLAELISLAIGVSPTRNGLIYFVLGILILVITLTTSILLPRNRYFKYFMYKQNAIGINEFENDLVGSPKISYKLIFKKSWHYILSGFVVCFVTLSIQPGVTVLIKSYGTGIWSDHYFKPVITFLLPNACDCFGRILSQFTEWPKNRYVLILLNVIRIGIIPSLMFCNLEPREKLPVIFNSDTYYIVFMAINGFTMGYLMNIAMINIPKVVEHHEKYSAGLITGIFIALAVNLGSLFSLVLVKVI